MIKNFFKLYFKSLSVIFKADKLRSSLLSAIIPLQALMPSLLIYSANKIINAALEKNINGLFIILFIWAAAFLLSNILQPVYTTIQGFLTDKLTLYLNTSLMNKSKTITELYIFEDSRFYDDVDILCQEASWRPVNLLVFGASIISSLITAVSMLVLLADFGSIISILMLIAIIPQSIVFYKIQKEAFEVLVSNTPDARKLSYYSSILLSKENIKDVQLYGLYDFFIDKYKDTFKRINKGIKRNRLKKLLASVFFLSVSTVISIFVFNKIIENTFFGIHPAGSILVFSSSILYTTQSISRLVEDSSLLYDTLLYMQKYFDFISLPANKGGTKLLSDTCFNKIIFDNVSFKYKPNKEFALQNISFSVSRGEKIAIAGENGSGKTTMMKLLCRFYKPASGQIKFDDTSITEYDIFKYRKIIGAVFQDYAKFDLTVRENIGLSDLKNLNNDDKILSALKKAGFDKTCKPDTLLGTQFEDGRDLSGGQWQKLAIARAFFGNFKILILDEPTASLDPRSEFALYERFLELAKGNTVFFITHRLSTVKKADKVLVLKNGKIEGFDTHSALMENNEYYAELYNMQASSFQN
ncbi:ABC transporter ATP-binding protein [Treponema pedis]|uniref:ABC transporter ATP-binding protein/peptidase n=1 Tax=Treponema pedis str. T A4 TaxID=1291379 RepID=S5ZWR8_9SPIR|nr:ABC transporter ATP-binding protein [Treponema pedis]AGT44855.1 ABC transporter ATP-binding protein/peptidase [Treponema pedis str. T A4]